MANKTDQIKELLGNGLSNELVASATGVTSSYISQLMFDEEFHSAVVTLRSKTLTAATKRDRTWDGIEDQLLARLGDLTEAGMIYKPNDLLKALQVVNSAKRRGSTSVDRLSEQQNVITLNIPTMVVNTFRQNSKGEVIEVTHGDDKPQTLVTMPAIALMRKLASTHEGTKYGSVLDRIPGGNGESEE